MKKALMLGLWFAQICIPGPARADLFGGDLPLLAEIVMNTLQTLRELEAQTSLAKAEMNGIRDKISRMKTIAELVQPSSWEEWKAPEEGLRRLRQIYFTLPDEYKTEKTNTVERELSNAMAEIGRLTPEVKSVFLSGKELEAKGADVSPGVAQKLTASGVGTLVSMSAQQQVLTSHITSLLVQVLAQKHEEEAREVVASGSALKGIARSLSQKEKSFSQSATAVGGKR
jgi:hypothetical protein